MKKVNRKEEPDFWKKYKKIHSKECYADLKKSVQGNILRRDMRDFLLRSQYGLCAYCCRRINLDNSLIEHIKPQVAYPKETMNYGNLIASCKNEGENATCGVKKADLYDEKFFVSPLEDDCEKEFVFYPNGQIAGVGMRGEYTCKLLNLNAYELQRARMAQYKACASFQDEEMIYMYFLTPDENGNLAAYSDMIQFFYDRGDFGIKESK